MNLESIAQQFIDWTKNKIRRHLNQDKEIYFREREIWWAAMGKNIGYETDGKNELFERPVLILKKYSKEMCFILPVSTQAKEPKPWYQVVLDMKSGRRTVNITQARTISLNRLLRKKDLLNTEAYNKVVDKFTRQFFKNK